jgi:hypothetical protein
LKNDVSVPKLLRKGVDASKQIQQAERRKDKQLFHKGYLSNDRRKMGYKENGSILQNKILSQVAAVAS